MNKKIVALPAAVLCLAALAACGHKGSASAAESSVKASTHAFATSSAGQYDKAQAAKLVRKCFPASETAQLRLAEPKKGKPGRQAVENCLKIPAGPNGANRTAFDDALLNALIHGHLRTSAGRTQLIEVTIPQLVVKYQ